jgi:hypothetical protein
MCLLKTALKAGTDFRNGLFQISDPVLADLKNNLGVKIEVVMTEEVSYSEDLSNRFPDAHS